MVFTRNGRQNKRLIHCSLSRHRILWALVFSGYKMKDFKHRKLPIFKSAFVPIFICGHKSWLVTEKWYLECKRQRQVFAKRSRRNTSRQNTSCWSRKALNVETLPRIEKSHVRPRDKNAQKQVAKRLLARPTGKPPRVRPSTIGIITRPARLGRAVVWSLKNSRRLLKNVRFL